MGFGNGTLGAETLAGLVPLIIGAAYNVAAWAIFWGPELVVTDPLDVIIGPVEGKGYFLSCPGGVFPGLVVALIVNNEIFEFWPGSGVFETLLTVLVGSVSLEYILIN